MATAANELRGQKVVPRSRLGKYWLPILFLLPAAFFLLAFTAVPLIQSVVLSFQRWNGIRRPTWVGLRNYQLLARRRCLLAVGRATALLHHGDHRLPDHDSPDGREFPQFRHSRKHHFPLHLFLARHYLADHYRAALVDDPGAELRHVEPDAALNGAEILAQLWLAERTGSCRASFLFRSGSRSASS